MKKLSILLLTFALATTLTTGCGNETKKEGKTEEPKDVITSKTCTLTEEGVMDQEFILTATNDEIDKVKLVMVYDNSMFEVDTLSTLTDDQKEQIKENMLTTLELESDTYEGLTIDIEIEHQMTVTLDADLKKADEEVLKKVGLDFTDADMSLETAVKDLTDGGAVCK